MNVVCIVNGVQPFAIGATEKKDFSWFALTITN